MMTLEIKTAPIFEPLLYPKRYKGAKGGRGSGKSHFFAEAIIEAMLMEPNLRVVCIREIQKSLKFSSKSVIEAKIRDLGVESYFEILSAEIRAKLGNGIIIFQGMQDHTADSIKSLEGFDIAWVEEAQNLSKKSLDLLRPTIRKEGSEIWFSWNPENETDAVDSFFRSLELANDDDFTLVHANFYDNPFLPQTLANEEAKDKKNDPENYDHKWLGAYKTIADAIIFKDKFEVGIFYPTTTPYHGLDFGFSKDPMACVRCYYENGIVYVESEVYGVNIILDDMARLIRAKIPEIENYAIRADNSQPQTIEYLKRNGLPKMISVKKGRGSVESGIEFLRNSRIIINPNCDNALFEFRNYAYKVDKRSGDILPSIVDENNHLIDAIRYALEPIISQRTNPKKRAILLDNL